MGRKIVVEDVIEDGRLTMGPKPFFALSSFSVTRSSEIRIFPQR
jgi:hypothetical protein